MNQGNFRVTLLRVSDQLSHTDLENLRFLCQTVITPARMEKVVSGLDLFNALEERGMLYKSNTDFLHLILRSIKSQIPLNQLNGDGYVWKNQLPSSFDHQEYRFYDCLLGLAMTLQTNEMEQIKFRFKSDLQISLDKIFSITDLFRLLIQRRIITPKNMRVLYDSMREINRHDLSELINKYLIDSGQQACPTEPAQGYYAHQNDHAHPQAAHQQTRPQAAHQQVHPQAAHQQVHPQAYQPRQGDQVQRGQTQANPPAMVHPVEATPDEHGDRQLRLTHSGQLSYMESASSSMTPRLGSVASFESTGSSPSSSLSTRSSMEQQLTRSSLSSANLDGQREPSAAPRVYVAGNNVINQGGVRCGFTIGEPLQSGESMNNHGGLILDPLDQVEQHLSPQDSQGVSPPTASQELMMQRELFMREEESRKYQQKIEQLQGQIGSKNQQQMETDRGYKEKIDDYEALLEKLTKEVEIHRQEAANIQEILRNSGASLNDGDYYRMNKSPHGICLIINNHKFYHERSPDKAHPERGGAHVDLYNLRKTFQYLQYKVEVHENLSSQAMNKAMLDMARRDHSQYDSFLCCILTHGEREVVHGADSNPVNLNDLTGVMKMCDTLQGKPKLFIIQACRGEAEGEAVKLEDDLQRDAGGSPYTNTIPKEADFFFGFATPTGNAAYRSRRFGSWFISEVCQVFINNAYTLNLNAMMKKVNNRVAQAYTKDGHKQAPEFVDRLRFQVHFLRFIPKQLAIESNE